VLGACALLVAGGVLVVRAGSWFGGCVPYGNMGVQCDAQCTLGPTHRCCYDCSAEERMGSGVDACTCWIFYGLDPFIE
jgi:hypothetical protein